MWNDELVGPVLDLKASYRCVLNVAINSCAPGDVTAHRVVVQVLEIINTGSSCLLIGKEPTPNELRDTSAHQVSHIAEFVLGVVLNRPEDARVEAHINGLDLGP